MNRISKNKYYLEIAKVVSKRSNCLKRHYGCVIVKNDEIISTGYNGSPRGEINCCDLGKCNRLDIPHNSGNYSNCFSVHAEQNAIISASRKDMMGATMYLYGEEDKSPWDDIQSYEEIDDCQPCPICKRMIANSGIRNIITNTSAKVNLSNEIDCMKCVHTDKMLDDYPCCDCKGSINISDSKYGDMPSYYEERKA